METQTIQISGMSLIGGNRSARKGAGFHGVNPTNNAELQPVFYSATMEEIEQAVTLAVAAAPVLARLSGRERARLLRKIAENMTAAGAAIIERANLETGLPQARLQGELTRTTNQLKLFADVLDEGSWVGARIDDADEQRKPTRRPDIRSMSRPLGPVVVFGASNFPLAFSVAGGDVASALAAGNPVIVKAHPAHPGTSEVVGRIVQQALEQCGLPAGAFALLFDAGIEVGTALVQHPAIRAVGFTGSVSGGTALMRLASGRPEPIPCYAEMGSTNPVFILPNAMRKRNSELAQALQASFTASSGQMCTKPGIVFVPEEDAGDFTAALQSGVNILGPFGMLTPGIAEKYDHAIQQRLNENAVHHVAGKHTITEGCAAGSPIVFSVPLGDFVAHPELEEEIFGPTTLLVHYGAGDDLLKAAEGLGGHLTATIHGTENDLSNFDDLVRILETKAGRIVFNGFPTGVEVNHAMVHGGPFPATSDSRTTSVGTLAIERFVRPLCYQDFPDTALPQELQRANPLGIMRLVNGNLTRDGQAGS
ncbi:MAG TPA: aldehyde dehydrogenase (NADP(+)) [Acidobacteriaceae bacterium]|nr:aldehyde dehydrogenase (NADP(+)) [Acidobacteriaceae bacterium]